MVDLNKLKNAIKDSGIKVGFIAEKLGLSRGGLYKKMNGQNEFLLSEVATLTSILQLDENAKNNIFFAKEVSKKETEQSG